MYVFVYTHTVEYYSAIEEWNNTICNNIDEPRDYHIKWSQKEANTIWYHLHVESNEKWYKRTYKTNRFKDFESKFMVTIQRANVDKLGSLDWHMHNTICKMDR